MNTFRRITESFAAPLAGGAVDRDAGVIKNVLVCGYQSANGRRYPWGKGLSVDPKVYEGRPVNVDHGTKATCERRFGLLQNVRIDSDGRPRADLHVLKSHPLAERVFEAAEKYPALFGLSHVAMARTRMESGQEVIEAIQSVESVDLVADPATTKSLYESIQPMPTTLKKFLEAVAAKKPAAGKWVKAKWVREMDEVPLDPTPEMDGAMDAPEVDPAAGITEAFKTAISQIVDEALAGTADPKEALNKIKKMLAAHGDINGDGKVDEADIEAAGDDMEEDDLPAMESKGAKFVLQVLADLEKAGVKPILENIDLVASVPTDKRPTLLRKLSESGKSGEQPTTTGRSKNTPVSESKSKPKLTGESIASLIRE